MSGLVPPPIYNFRKALQARGESVAGLAREAGLARHHLSRILWGHFAGASYWPRVRACVTAHEWDMLLGLPHVAAWQASAQARAHPYAVRWVCSRCGTGLGFRAAGVETGPGVRRAGICPLCLARGDGGGEESGVRRQESGENPPAGVEAGLEVAL